MRILLVLFFIANVYADFPPIKGEVTLALDNFRSLPEGSWQGNMGSFVSINLKAFLPRSFALQLGGSYGLYDWAGRTSSFTHRDEFQQQAFVTGAVLWETPCASGFNLGVAYDAMCNKELGVFAVDPFMTQIRGQLGYLIKSKNEIGVWVSHEMNTSHQESRSIPLQFRAINQANVFWCHYFCDSSYGMLWVGAPYGRGLMHHSGRDGKYLLGARFQASLTRTLSITGHGTYMGAHSSSNGAESKNYAADVCFGLTYSFGNTECLTSSPYMSLADNSNFIVDTNINF